MTIDRTPRTFRTARATVTVDALGVNVVADASDVPALEDWQSITDEAFDVLGGEDAMRAEVEYSGNFIGGPKGKVEELFRWKA